MNPASTAAPRASTTTTTTPMCPPGQHLYVIFVVMTYSGGMPILYLVAAFHFATSFWVEKFELLRVCKVRAGRVGKAVRCGCGRRVGKRQRVAC